MIQHGIHHLHLAATGETLSVYHLEAGIAACHSIVATTSDTDWPRILALYDELVKINPSPVAALNRAVALGKVSGPQAALDALEQISTKGLLGSYHLFHAVRGSLLLELQRQPEALVALRKAERLATLPSECEFIARLIQETEQQQSIRSENKHSTTLRTEAPPLYVVN